MIKDKDHWKAITELLEQVMKWKILVMSRKKAVPKKEGICEKFLMSISAPDGERVSHGAYKRFSLDY